MVRSRGEAEQQGAGSVIVIPVVLLPAGRGQMESSFRNATDAIGILMTVRNHSTIINVDLTPPISSWSIVANGSRMSISEVTRARDIVPLCGEQLTLFEIEPFVAGAQGWFALAPNVAPPSIARLFELVADQGRISKGRDLWNRQLPTIDAVSVRPSLEAPSRC